jgi:hypothetical protein
MDFFFYGTLLDRDVRRAVLGPGADTLAIEPALLPGYRRIATWGTVVPGLVRQSGAVTEGLIVRGITDTDGKRLDRYEGRGYRRIPCEILAAAEKRPRALVYIAIRRQAGRGAAWSLAGWQRRHKRRYLRSIARWMAGARR